MSTRSEILQKEAYGNVLDNAFNRARGKRKRKPCDEKIFETTPGNNPEIEGVQGVFTELFSDKEVAIDQSVSEKETSFTTVGFGFAGELSMTVENMSFNVDQDVRTENATNELEEGGGVEND